MEILVTISTLFVVGSLVGWLIELLFRRFVSQKRWMNPGFLVGPYLPIYGSGTVCLYAIARLGSLFESSLPLALAIVLKVVLITITMTVVEYIAGLIFIKGMGIKLWDYSDRWGNIQGIICPLFTLFWGLAGAGYLFLLDPILVDFIYQLSQNIIYCFFVGIVVGMMIVDFAYSIHLGVKLSKIAKENKLILNFESFKLAVKDKLKLGESKTSFRTLVLAKNHEELKTVIEDTMKKLPKIKKWWKKDEKSAE